MPVMDSSTRFIGGSVAGKGNSVIGDWDRDLG